MTEAAKADPATSPEAPKSRWKLGWVGTTYFAEGLPYSIVRILASIYFTDIGAKERYIGYLNALGAPWNAKFLWAPFVDAIGTKRRWLVAMQLLISVLIAAVAATTAIAMRDPTRELNELLLASALVFVGIAFLAATNDIAIDGYYQDLVSDKGEQAAYSGHRTFAYRLAVIFARSGLVGVAAWGASTAAGENKYLGWTYAFGAGAAVMFAVAVLHAFKLPHVEAATVPKNPREVLRSYGQAFRSYLDQDKIWLILPFILFYKLGDEILFSLNSTFLMRELHVTKPQMVWLGGFVGMGAMIGGSMLGGWWIKKQGLKKAIWPLTLAMNVNIWAYCWLAYSLPDAGTTNGLLQVVVVHAYEFFVAGLGTSALIVFLLRTCKAEHKAAHYAFGTALMSVGATVIGSFAGDIVAAIGYLNLFILAFIASIPGMVLLFFVPIRDS